MLWFSGGKVGSYALFGGLNTPFFVIRVSDFKDADCLAEAVNTK